MSVVTFLLVTGKKIVMNFYNILLLIKDAYRYVGDNDHGNDKNWGC